MRRRVTSWTVFLSRCIAAVARRPLPSCFALAVLVLLAPPEGEGSEAQTLDSPSINVTSTALDFGMIEEYETADLTVHLSNRARTPASILRVSRIVATGDGFSLARSPVTPTTFPGDGSRLSIIVRFYPERTGPHSGTVVVDAENARPVTVTLRGTASPVKPVQDEIVLGEGKEFVFENHWGKAFMLTGGEVLHFRWEKGIVTLNGARFFPGPSVEECLQLEPRTKEMLERLYGDVPFIRQRIPLYGDTDAGWRRSYAEWDSVMTYLVGRMSDCFELYSSLTRCRDLLETLDDHDLIASAATSEADDSIKITWRGCPPVRVMLGGRRDSPRIKTCSRHCALMQRDMLRSSLASTGAVRVEIVRGIERSAARSSPLWYPLTPHPSTR